MSIDRFTGSCFPIAQFSSRISDLNNPGAILSSLEFEKIEKIPESKRQSWIAGRYCAKRSVFRVCDIEWNDERASSLSIINDESGRPSVVVHDTHMQIGRTHISISHAKEYAYAAAVLGKNASGIGVDMEQIRTFPPDVLREFLTDREYRVYAESNDQPKMATLIWCIKEAYLKAIGTGLTIHPRRVEIIGDMDVPQKCCVLKDGIQQRVCIDWTTTDDLYILVTIVLL